MEDNSNENTEVVTSAPKSSAKRRMDEAPGQKKPGVETTSYFHWGAITAMAFLILLVAFLVTNCRIDAKVSKTDFATLKTDIATLQTDKANASDLEKLNEKVDLTGQKLAQDIDGKFDNDLGQQIDKDVAELKKTLTRTRTAVGMLKNKLSDKATQKRLQRVERKLDAHIATAAKKPPGTYTIVQRPVLVDGE